jgi:periplasmic protein CpxP/Spy
MMKNVSIDKSITQKVARWVVAPMSIVLLASVGYVNAGPHFGGGHHGMMNPLEKMVDHVDLSDEQESQVDAVLSKMKHEKGMRNGFKMMTSVIALDPESPDYDAKVEQQADAMAAKMRAKVIAMSAARKEIYAILTPEQKQELNEEISRHLERMEKRMDKRMKKHEKKARHDNS